MKTYHLQIKHSALLLILLDFIICGSSFSPTYHSYHGTCRKTNHFFDDCISFSSLNKKSTFHSKPSTHLQVSSAPLAAISTSIVKTSTKLFPPAVRNTLILIFGFLLIKQRQRLLYPRSFPDASFVEPLPPGKINGCPLLGNLSFLTDMNNSVSKLAHISGNPTPAKFKFFGFGKPVIAIAGLSNIKKLMKREFGGGVGQYADFHPAFLEAFLGTESMLFEINDGKRYRSLQKLVGQALTPTMVAKSIPALQELSEGIVDDILNKKKRINMKEMAQRFTLDVTWKQIIGLDLKSKNEIENFRKNAKIWTKAIEEFILYILPLPLSILKKTKQYKAKQYLNKLIEGKIDKTLAEGPDSSTISNMIYAVDDEAADDNTKKLSRQQVIDNVFVLILVGFDTSSLTLTNAMLLLGLHPNIWEKVVIEQEELIAKHGEELTKDQLDNECKYLNAVVKETMRILPISGGLFRGVDETFVMDGFQIPKEWLAVASISLTHELDKATWKEDGSHMDVKIGFKPERWLNEETKPTEFIPYGVGTRYCLGHHLANAEMRTFLAILARRVKSFNLVADTKKLKWLEGFIITPKDGALIDV